jgi:hypothetical protein
MSLQLKITLNHTKPPVWRRILVPDQFSFHQLHLAIQAAMGWHNSHLYAFRHSEENKYIGIPYPDLDYADVVDAREIKVKSNLSQPNQTIIYEYDFGDSWEHTILLEDITDGKLPYPVALAGKGACPPEDCGGIPGYHEFLKALMDPEHPEYYEYKTWLGLDENGTWDPMAFDLKQCNHALKQYLDVDEEL